VQSQVALLSTDARMREKALQQIESGVDRAGHLLEQLLRLARLDPVQRLEQPVPVALGAMVREVIGTVRGAHPEADRELVDRRCLQQTCA
jgi:two-component system, OmpR family, sensor histidine kinase QseC